MAISGVDILRPLNRRGREIPRAEVRVALN
jgi:hypothetical protein